MAYWNAGFVSINISDFKEKLVIFLKFGRRFRASWASPRIPYRHVLHQYSSATYFYTFVICVTNVHDIIIIFTTTGDSYSRSELFIEARPTPTADSYPEGRQWRMRQQRTKLERRTWLCNEIIKDFASRPITRGDGHRLRVFHFFRGVFFFNRDKHAVMSSERKSKIYHFGRTQSYWFPHMFLPGSP